MENSKYLPLDEKHPTTPLSPYGLTKLFGEKYLDYTSNNKENFKSYFFKIL